VLTTHVTAEGAMQKSLRAISKLRAVHGTVHVLRLWHDAEVAAPRLL
jgi:hypothetical protein